jgi:hypothetical protein
MKLINDLDLKKVVAIDIETVRIVEHYKDLSEQYKLAWQYKQKQDGVVPDEVELADLWERTASLYAEFSKVCAVSLAFINKKGELDCMEYFRDNEAALLNDVADILDRLYMANFILVGHAAKYFDYPFLCKRYIINHTPIPKLIDTAHQKPWENRNLCTNQDIWKMGGTGPGSSLIALCVSLGIPISKVDLVGDEVGKAYYEGKYADIGRYCSYDAICTFNILRRIKGEEIFDFSSVNFK